MTNTLWAIPVLALAVSLTAAADDGGAKSPSPSAPPNIPAPAGFGPGKYVPPVMRNGDAGDTILVVLPGPAAAPVAPPAATAVVRPAADGAPTAAESADASTVPPSNEASDGPRPYYRRAAKVYPDEFQADTLKFLHDRLGKWAPDDVVLLLGPSTRQRPAYGEDQKENGMIMAFSDPTNKFREFELDFDANSGMLRTVFAYPIQMTWQDCRKQFGAKVTATDASKGRKFYSYADRRLDVLVGPDGRVVSLGLY